MTVISVRSGEQKPWRMLRRRKAFRRCRSAAEIAQRFIAQTSDASVLQTEYKVEYTIITHKTQIQTRVLKMFRLREAVLTIELYGIKRAKLHGASKF